MQFFFVLSLPNVWTNAADGQFKDVIPTKAILEPLMRLEDSMAVKHRHTECMNYAIATIVSFYTLFHHAYFPSFLCSFILRRKKNTLCCLCMKSAAQKTFPSQYIHKWTYRLCDCILIMSKVKNIFRSGKYPLMKYRFYCHRMVVVKSKLSQKAKLSIHRSNYIPTLTLTYGHELWLVTERMRSRIQASKISFFLRVCWAQPWR